MRAVVLAVALAVGCSTPQSPPEQVVREAGFVLIPEGELLGAEEQAGIDVFFSFAVSVPNESVDDFLTAGAFPTTGVAQDEAVVEGRHLFREVAVHRRGADRSLLHVRAYTT